MTTAAAPKTARAASQRVSPLCLALGMTAALAAFGLIPWVRENPRLAGSVWGACGVLVALALAVYLRASRAGRVLRIEVAPKKVHYVQLAMHTSMMLATPLTTRQVPSLRLPFSPLAGM